MFTHPRVGRTQTALLILLLLTLAATGILTRQGHKAAEGEKEAVERALIQNAKFAAYEYNLVTQDNIASFFGALFFNHKNDEPLRIDVTRFRQLTFNPQNDKDCNCALRDHIIYQYAFDYSTGEFSGVGPISDADRSRIIDILRTHPRKNMKRGWEMALVADQLLPSGWITGFAVRHEVTGADTVPRYAIGFGAMRSFTKLALMEAESFNPTLPHVTTEPSQDAYAISVFDAGRDALLESGEGSVKYAAEDTLPDYFGSLRVRAAVNPRFVPAIAGGAVPGPGLEFPGLMLVTSILIFSVLILSKRESEIARVRADFVSSVSHELRTPLAQIRMFTETLLLGRTRNDSERKRSLEIIDQEAKRLTALVDNVLHVSRAERGAARLAPTAMPLSPVAREVVDTFAQLPRSRGVEYRTELEDRLIAQVDANAFRQILLNLLDNAVKYGPSQQRIYVGLAMFEQHARLWIDDEGPGIPLRERERVFEPFYRSSLHHDSKVVGTGIGLAVVRELAGLLGGSVWAEDAPGGGARVIVEFPEAYLRAEETTAGSAVA
jgi:signal transduction histidine kinase